MAPVIPDSSLEVINTSKDGWDTSFEASMAKLIATAIPLSAPKVVPSA